MGLFVGHYVLSLMLFGLGLRAPGIVSNQDYMNLNDTFHTRLHPPQVRTTSRSVNTHNHSSKGHDLDRLFSRILLMFLLICE